MAVPPSWILNLKRWPAFNQEIETHLEKKNFTTINVPDETMIIFTEALEADNNTNFKMVSPEGEARQEPRRPWWNEDCANLVKNAKRLFKVWKKSPLSTGERQEWNKAEALKKKGILSAKKQAWTSFINELGSGGPAKNVVLYQEYDGQRIITHARRKTHQDQRDNYHCSR
jgi:hypothetical protein